MSKIKHILIGVKIVIFLVACVLGYMFYQNYTLSQKKQEELKKIHQLYNDSKWVEAVTGYKDYIRKYPEKKLEVESRMSTSLQNLANEKSIKAIAIPGTDKAGKQAANREVIQILTEAKEYGDLNEMSLMILCDAHIECNEFDKAKTVIKEAKSRGDIDGNKFLIHERRMEQAAKKK